MQELDMVVRKQSCRLTYINKIEYQTFLIYNTQRIENVEFLHTTVNNLNTNFCKRRAIQSYREKIVTEHLLEVVSRKD